MVPILLLNRRLEAILAGASLEIQLEEIKETEKPTSWCDLPDSLEYCKLLFDGGKA
jgi:hypothetical protein